MGMNAVYRGPQDCPTVIPMFPLPGALLLPRGQMPLNIFEPRYLAMVDDAFRADRMIGMIQPDADGGGTPLVPKLYQVGCAGRITQFAETGDGRYLITHVGVARFRVLEELATTTLYRHDFHRLWHRFDRLGPGAPDVADLLAFPDQPSSNQIYYGILTGTENSDPSVPATSIILANNDRTFVSQGVQSTLTYSRERGRIRHQIRAGARRLSPLAAAEARTIRALA